MICLGLMVFDLVKRKGGDYMTRLPQEMFYWMTDKEWYRINMKMDRFELTDKAPERAKRSFDMYNNPEKYGIHIAP